MMSLDAIWKPASEADYCNQYSNIWQIAKGHGVAGPCMSERENGQTKREDSKLSESGRETVENAVLPLEEVQKTMEWLLLAARV